VGHGGDDPGAVALDPVVEVDERGDLAATGPLEPGVEHGGRFVTAVLEHEPEMFLEQVGAVEAVVVLRDPGELGGLAVGEVFGVLPERVATVLQLLGSVAETHGSQRVPHPAAHDVEGLGGPSHDVKRIKTQGRVLAVGGGAVADPLGRIGRDQANLGGPLGSEEIKELLEGGPVVTGLGPHQPAGVVVDHDHQVLVATPIRDLVDPDPLEPIERIAQLPSFGHDPGGDRTHGPPRDAQQLDHRRLRRVRHQPRDLVVEVPRVARTMARPGHPRDRHPMIPAANSRRFGLDEHPRRAGVQRPPTAPSFALVVATRASLTNAAAQLRVGSQPASHHDRIIALVDVDRLDHHASVDADRPRP